MRTAVLVSGYREWTSRDAILHRLNRYEAGTILLHGDCGESVRNSPDPWDWYHIGADKIAGEIGKILRFHVHAYPAHWDLGKRGGPHRNDTMLDVLLVLQRRGYDCHFEAFLHPNSVGIVRMIESLDKHNSRLITAKQIPKFITKAT